MRIAFFVQSISKQGTFFRWHNLAIALKQLGHEVDVYANDFNYKAKDRTEIIDGIKYDIVSETLFSKIASPATDPINAFKRWKKRYPSYDVVHLFQPFLSAYIPWNKIRRTNKTLCVYDWDDLWTGGLFNKKQNLSDCIVHTTVAYLESTIPKQVKKVTVCSSFLKNKLPHASQAKILVNGFWPKQKYNRTDARIKWKLRDDFFYLAFIGRTAGELSWFKALIHSDYFTQNPHLQLVIAGLPANVLSSADLHHERVLDMGILNAEQASELASAVDLGLVPLEDNLFNQSRFPIKFFDFLSVQTPVYISGVGDIKEIAQNTNGAYVGSAEMHTWLNTLEGVINTIQADKPVIDVEALCNQFSWTSIAAELVAYYKLNGGK